MTNFNDMLSKAKAMQDKMKEAQDKIKKIEVNGEAGGNLVKVVLTGDYEIKSILISEEAKKEDQEIILTINDNGEINDESITAINIINLPNYFQNTVTESNLANFYVSPEGSPQQTLEVIIGTDLLKVVNRINYLTYFII